MRTLLISLCLTLSVQAVQSNAPLAVDLYQQLSPEPGNLFFSPTSISMAMALAYQGAQDKTAQQMAQALHFSDDPAVVTEMMSQQIERINSADNNDVPTLSLANALWIQQDFNLLEGYQQTLITDFQAHYQEVDFIKASEQARQTINDWVAHQTRDKIKDLLQPGSLNALTRLVLTNAIYFNADWQSPFDMQGTRPAHFHLADGQTIDVPMMQQESQFLYHETESAQWISLPYQGGQYAMGILLPKPGHDLAEIEATLDPQDLQTWQGSGRTTQVELCLPRFTFSQALNLNNTLRQMGITAAFDPQAANFSGINGKQNLFISSVVHQAFIAVDESGTEAAAATGVTIGVTSIQPPASTVFKADHPFIFLIQDTQNNDILFMGRVSDPS